MADLIIIHAHADAERARALADALRTRGFEVALSGEPAQARAAIAVWSERELLGEEARRGAAEAQARGALLGVSFGPVEEGTVVGAVEVDLSGWPGPGGEAAFERLVQAAARLRGRPAMAAATRVRDDALLQRVLFATGAAILTAVAAIGLTPAMRPNALPTPGAEVQVDAAEQAVEFTDSPGATESYGLTEEEVRVHEPRDLIELALQRTAIETIEIDAARGDALGLTLLCLAQTFGEGLPRDADGAQRSCTLASRARDGLATYMLSTFSRKGQEGYAPNPGDAALADRLLEQAARQGDPRAQTELAHAHLKASRTADALALARRAAEQGYAPAQVLIGQMYESGAGLTQDYEQAMQWYARAERTGSAAGARAIGALYESGAGVAQDYAIARRRYEQASDMGDGEASHRLANLIERGLGGVRDITRARLLYRRALAQGYADAQADVDRVGPG